MDDSSTSYIENAIPLKIAVLGQSMVGKSAITFRFIKNKFPTQHDTTIEDAYSVPAKVDGIQCNLEILDTAGQDDYQTMLDTWISSVDGFILVYSIDNKKSFESIQSRYERILRIKNTKTFAIIIVGNKCDLEDNRQVNREEAENYSNEKKIYFLETSALKMINIKEVFLYLTRELLKIKFPEKYKKKDDIKVKKSCVCF